jgi:autoinducer 2-degrading protein
MIVTLVHVEVKPEHVEEFIRATIENHYESVKEPGNLRFDVLRNDAQANRFLLYEAYENDEKAAAHKLTAHYLKWRETVAPWMASPREGIRHTAIVPDL